MDLNGLDALFGEPEAASVLPLRPVAAVDPTTWPAWTKRCPYPPRQHQVDGVAVLLAPPTHIPEHGTPQPILLNGDEVGAGKTMQTIDAAQLLFEADEINAVIVCGPAQARGVWANPDPALGEIAKHSFADVPYACREYSVIHDDLSRLQGIHSNVDEATLRSKPFLRWVITNYEFIRRPDRLGPLLSWAASRRFWLICDEGWALANQTTSQWRAVYALRRLAKRVTILNGTPLDTPLDLNAQMRMLDERILGFPYTDAKGRRKISCADYRFRHHYGGFERFMEPNQKTATREQMQAWSHVPLEMRWPRLGELRDRVAPYAIRRLTRDCFDLPPELPPVLIEARLGDPTWRPYKQMRDHMVATLDDGTASVAKQAIVKGLRLSQITSGFLGGVERLDLEGDAFDFGPVEGGFNATAEPGPQLREIGREKLDATIEWLRHQQLPKRILIWCQFRAEIERAAPAFAEAFGYRMHLLYGEQSDADRQAAIRALNPAIEQDGPVGVVGSGEAGGAALNLAGASMAITISGNFKLRVHLQKKGRIDRPGQVNPIRYVDVVATGPKGQRTVDHVRLAALRDKHDVARWTTATWRKKLLEE